jgi:peptidoglycan/xylan/chitin deacetylase (PgdA/CDA1 family)
MIRNTTSVGTGSLLPGMANLSAISAGRATPHPVNDTTNEDGLFTHGLRSGVRELAVCFDLYDDATGLPTVLDALNRFGIRVTFFVNGEFLRRHPAAARDIVEAGHEMASLFYAPIELSNARYRIDGDFITRGLARNEDEFFQAVGAELGLIWHPPFFSVSQEIIAAAAEAGYKTIGRDVDPMDWVTRDESKRIAVEQFTVAEMIDRIMGQKQHGSIIPIRMGLLSGGRSDYLFNHIGLLLDALVRDGYSVVPVSTLMEHSR